MTQQKYPIGGYAPGGYYCKCCTCGAPFTGDKRAVQCEPCAVTGTERYNTLSPEEKEAHDRRVREAVTEVFKKFNSKP